MAGRLGGANRTRHAADPLVNLQGPAPVCYLAISGPDRSQKLDREHHLDSPEIEWNQPLLEALEAIATAADWNADA